MFSYNITDDAVQDLQDIAQYTLNKWGAKQLEKYRAVLKKRFEEIGKGIIIKRNFSSNLPAVFVTKSGSHYIFHLTQSNQKPVIIAVFHEARDILIHLTDRLGED